MRKSLLPRRRALTAALAVGSATAMAVGVGLVPAASAAEAVPVQHIFANRSGLALASSLPAGRTTFQVLTDDPNGGDVELVKLKPGVTLAQFGRDLHDITADDPQTNARGTREGTRDATWFGGAEPRHGQPVSFTETLYPGTYYAVSMNDKGDVSKMRRLTVRGPVRDRVFPPYAATVDFTKGDRIATPRVLPRQGTILLRNVADAVHFLDTVQVKPGTTDGQLSYLFKLWSQGNQVPPPFLEAGATSGVLSPGVQMLWTYDLPPGTYMLTCWVADEDTGMPHAFMGMHAVVTLK